MIGIGMMIVNDDIDCRWPGVDSAQWSYRGESNSGRKASHCIYRHDASSETQFVSIIVMFVSIIVMLMIIMLIVVIDDNVIVLGWK